MKAGYIFLGDHSDSIRTLPSSVQKVPTGLALAHGSAEKMVAHFYNLSATSRYWTLLPEHSTHL